MDLQSLLEVDRNLLHFFNGSNNMFLDSVVSTLTSGITWIPLYLALLCLIIKNNENILPKENSSCPDNLRYNLYMEAATNTKPTA